MTTKGFVLLTFGGSIQILQRKLCSCAGKEGPKDVAIWPWPIHLPTECMMTLMDSQVKDNYYETFNHRWSWAPQRVQVQVVVRPEELQAAELAILVHINRKIKDSSGSPLLHSGDVLVSGDLLQVVFDAVEARSNTTPRHNRPRLKHKLDLGVTERLETAEVNNMKLKAMIAFDDEKINAFTKLYDKVSQTIDGYIK